MTPEELTKKIDNLREKITVAAPKVAETLKSYHLARDVHQALVTEHRELQKQLKLMNGDYKKLPPHTNTKTKIRHKSIVAEDPKKLLSSLSDTEKAELRKLLLGD
jgi:hypothetical protein